MSTLWRHKKRGSIYEVIAQDASLQCSTNPSLETTYLTKDWTIYRSVESGSFYLRPTAEFNDGRFEKLP